MIFHETSQHTWHNIKTKHHISASQMSAHLSMRIKSYLNNRCLSTKTVSIYDDPFNAGCREIITSTDDHVTQNNKFVRIDWLGFNATFDNISVISRRRRRRSTFVTSWEPSLYPPIKYLTLLQYLVNNPFIYWWITIWWLWILESMKSNLYSYAEEVKKSVFETTCWENGGCACN